MSFLGGGTDYPECISRHGEGAVLGATIDKYVYCSATRFYSRLFDHSIRLSYRTVERVRSLDEIRHAPIRKCLELHGIRRDIEVGHSAELPAYSGLGSSSSFVVGLLNALHSFKGERVGPLDLAMEAIRVERRLLGDNVGLQDQTLSAVGGLNLVRFGGERDVRPRRLDVGPERLRELSAHLVLLFTGIQRRASDVISGQLDRAGENGPTVRRLSRLAHRGAEALEGAFRPDEFGGLIDEGWRLKRGLGPWPRPLGHRGRHRRDTRAGHAGRRLRRQAAGGRRRRVLPVHSEPGGPPGVPRRDGRPRGGARIHKRPREPRHRGRGPAGVRRAAARRGGAPGAGPGAPRCRLAGSFAARQRPAAGRGPPAGRPDSRGLRGLRGDPP